MTDQVIDSEPFDMEVEELEQVVAPGVVLGD